MNPQKLSIWFETVTYGYEILYKETLKTVVKDISRIHKNSQSGLNCDKRIKNPV